MSLAVSSLISSRFTNFLFSELLDRYWNLLCSHRDQYASLVCQRPLMNGFCSSCRCCFRWPDDTQHDALTNAVSKNVVRLDVVVLSGLLLMREG